VHWAVLAIVPVFALWSPPLLFAAMVAYGVVANVPCIAVQRFNRARIVRVLARRERALLPG
jgi:glycosyl-4,4'-diaponeurosporenoate acyltransferase